MQLISVYQRMLSYFIQQSLRFNAKFLKTKNIKILADDPKQSNAKNAEEIPRFETEPPPKHWLELVGKASPNLLRGIGWESFKSSEISRSHRENPFMLKKGEKKEAILKENIDSKKHSLNDKSPRQNIFPRSKKHIDSESNNSINSDLNSVKFNQRVAVTKRINTEVESFNNNETIKCDQVISFKDSGVEETAFDSHLIVERPSIVDVLSEEENFVRPNEIDSFQQKTNHISKDSDLPKSIQAAYREDESPSFESLSKKIANKYEIDREEFVECKKNKTCTPVDKIHNKRKSNESISFQQPLNEKSELKVNSDQNSACLHFPPLRDLNEINMTQANATEDSVCFSTSNTFWPKLKNHEFSAKSNEIYFLLKESERLKKISDEQRGGLWNA